jgi:hypothetical protein
VTIFVQKRLCLVVVYGTSFQLTMTFSADFGGHQGQDLNAQIDEIRTRPVRPQSLRIDRTLTFDGQQWDVSNLVTSSNPIFSASLYPKILADGCVDTHEETDRKNTSDLVITAWKKKSPPPASMTLRHHYQEHQQTDTQASLRDNPRTMLNAASGGSESESVSSSDDEHEETLMLEVAPGLEVKLRGSSETRRAIKNWKIIQVQCLECSVQLHCIEDAEFLLCPHCRCVSPLSMVGQVKTNANGVGLGFQSCPKPLRRRRRSPK